MFNRITVIVDEITEILIKPMSLYVNTILFSCSGGINSDVLIAANELNKLIIKKNEQYLFVASSIGVFTALTYAKNYPNKLMGLVLIDPSHPRQGVSLLSIISNSKIPNTKKLDDIKQFCISTNEASESGARELNSIVTLNNLPILVLIAGSISFGDTIPKEVLKLICEDRHQMLKEYTNFSEKGKYIIIPNVGHGIASEAPDVVSKLIKDFIEEIVAL